MKLNTIMIRTRKTLDSFKQLLKASWNYRRNLKLELFFFLYVMPTFCFLVSFDWAKCLYDCVDDDHPPLSEFHNMIYTAYVGSCTLCRDCVRNNVIPVIISLIAVVLAGSCADRFNKRKLFMILPIIGEMITYAGFIISAIFFDALSVEFGACIETYIKSFFGGFVTVIMSIFSYMAIITPERDRFRRFGVFFMFYLIIVLLGVPISRLLSTYCGYIASFSIALISQIIAILCVVFVVEDIDSEAKKKADSNEVAPLPSSLTGSGTDNMACEGVADSLEEFQSPTNTNENTEIAAENLPVDECSKTVTKPVKRNICLEIFDPTLIRDFVTFPLKKRNNNRRMLLILLICAYFFGSATLAGESCYWYHYNLVKLDVTDRTQSLFITFTSGMSLIGTFIGTAILNKVCGLNDSVIGLISVASVIASKLLGAFSSNMTIRYTADGISLFEALNMIAIKSIGSSIVSENEIGKFMAILETCAPVGKFIYPYAYDEFEDIRLLSLILYIPIAIVFIVCYIILRRDTTKAKKTETAEKLTELESKTQDSNVDT